MERVLILFYGQFKYSFHLFLEPKCKVNGVRPCKRNSSDVHGSKRVVVGNGRRIETVS